jgi:hypothetical protein
MCYLIFNSNPKIRWITVNMSTLQIKKLRHWALGQFTQGHISNRLKTWIQALQLQLKYLYVTTLQNPQNVVRFGDREN